MNIRKKIIIISSTIAIILIIGMLAVFILLPIISSSRDSGNNNPMKEQPLGGDAKEDVSKNLDSKLSEIENNKKLTDAQRRDETIKAMEEARKLYQTNGNSDKVTEIDANIKLLKSLPTGSNASEVPAADDAPVKQPNKEKERQ
jgi:UDP-N-acetylglucosamine:LPS N-acetylglucosamine transferase